jgi:hypothetical protein
MVGARRKSHVAEDTARELLTTWQVTQMQDVDVPRLPDTHSDPDWSWTRERRYGVPRLDERRNALEIALNVLRSKGRSVEAVVAALQQIKHLSFEDAYLGLMLNHQRHEAEESDKIRRNLTKWLKRAIQFHREINPDSLPAGLLFQRRHEALLMMLTFDPSMTAQERAVRDWILSPRQGAMHRRKTKGNPDAILVKTAHQVLSDAKVPRDLRVPLLFAIGLMDRKGKLFRRPKRIRK